MELLVRPRYKGSRSIFLQVTHLYLEQLGLESDIVSKKCGTCMTLGAFFPAIGNLMHAGGEKTAMRL
jgi:hypothetical protein